MRGRVCHGGRLEGHPVGTTLGRNAGSLELRGGLCMRRSGCSRRSGGRPRDTVSLRPVSGERNSVLGAVGMRTGVRCRSCDAVRLRPCLWWWADTVGSVSRLVGLMQLLWCSLGRAVLFLGGLCLRLVLERCSDG